LQDSQMHRKRMTPEKSRVGQSKKPKRILGGGGGSSFMNFGISQRSDPGWRGKRKGKGINLNKKKKTYVRKEIDSPG